MDIFYMNQSQMKKEKIRTKKELLHNKKKPLFRYAVVKINNAIF